MSLPDKYDSAQIENKWKTQWLDNQTYKWDPNLPRQRVYAIDTPPPTVSGSLHIGHIFSYTHTDLIARFQRMKGKNIYYPMGWDDNGLPTERRVQNVFGIRCDINKNFEKNWKPRKDKKENEGIEEVSRSNFIEACSQLTLEDEAVFKNLFTRLGLSVDWSLEYATIDTHSRKVSQLSFIDLVQKGEAYQMESPTLWDVDFQTAVAQAEVEDRDYPGFYHDLRFKLDGEDHTADFIISTTRPELLPACIAVVAHPEDERYKHLFGKFAITPLFYARVPILPSEHADPEKGSGILMVCTFGDTNDIDWWKKSQLPLKQIIGMNGKMLEAKFGESPFTSLDPEKAKKNYHHLVGLKVRAASEKIVELFKQEGNILVGDPRSVVRPVKFFEKGSRPLEFISTRQWFVHILKHREKLLEAGRKINWRPDFMRARFENWVDGLNQDWCISRQRYFGVPFPVWYPITLSGDIDYSRPILAKKEQLPVDPLVDLPPVGTSGSPGEKYKENQRNQPGGFTGEKDVMDTWATSSLTPQISSHWEFDQEKHARLFPMDLRPQSHEIIRTWAFYTIAKAYLHENKIPWGNVAISGWILDPDRKKMSKSKGNVVTPENFLDQYGADAVRYWSARARLGVDTTFDENLFKMGRKLCNKLFNASKFVLTQIESKNEFTWNAERVSHPLDWAWINKMRQLIDKVNKDFQSLDFAQVLQSTEECFWNFCDHYLEIVKGRSYSSSDLKGRASAVETLDWSLGVFVRLFAPFFPFLTEEIWSWRYQKQKGLNPSIHLSAWPECEEFAANFSKTMQGFDERYLRCAIDLLSAIRAKKTQEQKKLKWPVDSVKLKTNKEFSKIFQEIMPDIALAANVAEKAITILEVADTEIKATNPNEYFIVNVILAEKDLSIEN